MTCCLASCFVTTMMEHAGSSPNWVAGWLTSQSVTAMAVSPEILWFVHSPSLLSMDAVHRSITRPPASKKIIALRNHSIGQQVRPQQYVLFKFASLKTGLVHPCGNSISISRSVRDISNLTKPHENMVSILNIDYKIKTFMCRPVIVTLTMWVKEVLLEPSLEPVELSLILERYHVSVEVSALLIAKPPVVKESIEDGVTVAIVDTWPWWTGRLLSGSRIHGPDWTTRSNTSTHISSHP